LVAIVSLVTISAGAADSLPEQIDRLVAAKAGSQPLAPAAADAEFLRRATLDFAGDLPTPAEVRTFLADAAADKRIKLIDKLIDSPRFPERLADVLHVMLMERRGEDAKWRAYLVDSCKANKPWDVMAREILCTDYLDANQRGARKENGLMESITSRSSESFSTARALSRCTTTRSSPLITIFDPSLYEPENLGIHIDWPFQLRPSCPGSEAKIGPPITRN